MSHNLLYQTNLFLRFFFHQPFFPLSPSGFTLDWTFRRNKHIFPFLKILKSENQKKGERKKIEVRESGREKKIGKNWGERGWEMMKVTIITSFVFADPICVLSYHSTSFHSFLCGSDSFLSSYTIYPENESYNSFFTPNIFNSTNFWWNLVQKKWK